MIDHDGRAIACATAPAIEVMTDFEQITPASISPDSTLAEATKLMISRGVRLLFVARADGEILGVITARDTMGERPVKLLKELGGRHDDLRVSDVMTPEHMVEAIAMRDVLRAEVGHILQTLSRCQQRKVVGHHIQNIC